MVQYPFHIYKDTIFWTRKNVSIWSLFPKILMCCLWESTFHKVPFIFPVDFEQLA